MSKDYTHFVIGNTTSSAEALDPTHDEVTGKAKVNSLAEFSLTVSSNEAQHILT